MKRFLILAAALALISCASPPQRPECEPEIRIERYPLPVVVGYRIEIPESNAIEEIPPIPHADEGPEALKAWALEVNRITKSNRIKREARIRALESLIEANNRFADEHPPPTPTPEPSPIE